MAFRFESLTVWQNALIHCNEIDLMVKGFPREELYSLSSQIKRVADSVVLNIAEGSTGQSIPEYKRFLGIALRSAIEVFACYLLLKQGVILVMSYSISITNRTKYCVKWLPN